MPNFNIQVKVDPADARRGTAAVNRELRGVDRQARNLQRTLKTAFAFVGIASSIALLTNLSRSTIQYQDSLAEVSTLVDTTTFGMDRLSDAALRQAKEFGSQPVAQTKALYQIISAGAETAAEAVDTLNVANRLAVGGVTDVAIAADGLTSVLNAYGDRVEGARAVSDAMFVGMRAGKTTIQELSSSLGAVAPFAAVARVSFDELVASVAALTKGGISTTEAVTGVRAILTAVTKPAKEAADLAAQLRLNFSAAAIEARGFPAFLEDVIEKTGGSSEKLSLLFGRVQALVPILALTGKAGDDFANILEDMKNKAGATGDAFNKIAASPGFQMRRLIAAINVEAIKLVGTVSGGLVPALKAVADSLSTVVRLAGALLVIFGATKLVVALTSVRTGINLVNAALLTMTVRLNAATLSSIGYIVAIKGAGLATVMALGRMVTAIRALGVAILTNPFGLLATAVILLVALGPKLWDWWKRTIGQIKLGTDEATTFYDFLVAASAVIQEKMGRAWDAIRVSVSGAFDAIKTGIGPVLSALFPRIESIRTKFEEVFGDLEVSLLGLIELSALVVDKMIGVFLGAFLAIEHGWENVLDKMQGRTKEYEVSYVDVIQGIMDATEGMLPDSINRALQNALTVASQTMATDTVVPEGSKSLGQSVREGFEEGLGADMAQGLLSEILAEIARARTEIDKAKAPGGATVPTTAGAPTPTDPDAFRQISDLLQREIYLLGLSNDQRRIRTELYAIEAELEGKLGPNQEMSITRSLEEIGALERMNATIEKMQNPMAELRQEQEDWNRALAMGRPEAIHYAAAIGNINRRMLELRTDAMAGVERGLDSLLGHWADHAAQVERLTVGTFRTLEDNIVRVLGNSKENFRQFFDYLEREITRMAVRMAILKPIAAGIEGEGGSGLMYDIGTSISGLLGGSSGRDPFTQSHEQLYGAQHGLSFRVGGVGGPDSKVVAFRATPGEHVEVTPPGKGGGITVIQHIQTPDAGSFRGSTGNMAARWYGAASRWNRRNN